jgi:hypothetical protein
MSSEPHPLLAEELLKIKAPLQRDPPANRNSAEDNSAEVIDAFGSLSISVSGRASYYGSIANSWVRWSLILADGFCLINPRQYFLQVRIYVNLFMNPL